MKRQALYTKKKGSANKRRVKFWGGTSPACGSIQPVFLTKECLMSHIRVLICRVDDPASDQMTELAAFDLPATDVSALQPETALDNLETTTQETGNAILRRTLQAQWDLLDADLTDQHRQAFFPSGGARRRP